MERRRVLDACSFIAFFNGEEGSDVVERAFLDAEAEDLALHVHAVTVCEVYYDHYRAHGRSRAERIYETICGLPVSVVESIQADLLRDAGYLKATFHISLGDAFVIALGRSLHSPIITCDHAEFDVLEAKKIASFEWIR